MDPNGLEERYYQDTLQAIWQFEYFLAKEKAPPSYPDRDKLLDISIRICQMMRASLEVERESSSNTIDFNLFELCATYHRHLQRLQNEILDFVPLSDPSEQPFEIVEPLKTLIRKFEPDFALILRGYSKQNYELIAYENLYQSYVDKLSPYVPNEYRDLPTSPKWFIFFSFPQTQSRNILLHTITLSHEMLHLRDHILGITSELLRRINISAQDIKPLVERISATRLPTERPLLPPLTLEEVWPRNEIERATKEACSEILENWLSELVADLLATRIFGPAYFFSLARLSLSLGTMDQHSITHPCSRMRLQMMLQELRNLGYLRKRKIDEIIYSELEKWATYLREEVKPISMPPQSEPYCNIAESKILATKNTLMPKVNQASIGESYDAKAFHAEVSKLIELLNNGISPVEIKDQNKRSIKPASIVSILNAGYVFFLAHMDRLYSMLGSSQDTKFKGVAKLNELLLHAMQASTISQHWLDLQGKQSAIVENETKPILIAGEKRLGAPSKDELLDYIFAARISDQLIITPQLKLEPQNGALDIHLGTKFLLFRLTRYPLIDPSEITEHGVRGLLERLQLRFDEEVILHPSQLLLASTLEYLSIPQGLGASVITRSTYGRLGLITATSIYVHPGFKGCLTLELTNIGNSPIVLRPGERVAQLLFEYHSPGKTPLQTKYLLATEPEFPKMWEESDRELLAKLRGSEA